MNFYTVPFAWFLSRGFLRIYSGERSGLWSRKISGYVACVRINLMWFRLISMADECSILIYPYDTQRLMDKKCMNDKSRAVPRNFISTHRFETRNSHFLLRNRIVTRSAILLSRWYIQIEISKCESALLVKDIKKKKRGIKTHMHLNAWKNEKSLILFIMILYLKTETIPGYNGNRSGPKICHFRTLLRQQYP